MPDGVEKPLLPNENSEIDLEQLLAFAETLHEKCERLSSDITHSWMRFFRFVACCTVVALAIGLSKLQNMPIWMGVIVAALVVSILLNKDATSSLHQKFDREKRALHEVVELIREIEPVVAQKKHWTAITRAQFRIRLSRFDISEPGSSGPTSEAVAVRDVRPQVL